MTQQSKSGGSSKPRIELRNSENLRVQTCQCFPLKSWWVFWEILMKGIQYVVSHSVVSNSYNALDCSPPGSTARAIFQARMLEWVVISSSRGSTQLRDWTHVSCIADWFFTTEASEKPYWVCVYINFFACGWPVVPALFVEKSIFSPLSKIIFCWSVLGLCVVPLIYLSLLLPIQHCFDCCSFYSRFSSWVVSVPWLCSSTCIGYSRSFDFPYKL